MAETPKVFVPPTIEHSSWNRTEKRILLFTITRPNPDAGAYDDDGETVPNTIDVDYTIPGTPHVGLGLQFLKVARQAGTEVALSWLLEEAVGSEGYDALAAEPDLQPADLTAIMRKCRDVVLGGLSGPKG